MENYLHIKNASLEKFNTLRLNSIAENLVFPLNQEGLIEIYKEYKSHQIVMLGNGSNILLSKDYYDEDYVFINTKLLNDITYKENIIYVQAGVLLSELSWFALEKGVRGFEFLEDIPGSIGGAVVMNAGTYQDMIGDLITTVTYYNLENDAVYTDTAEERDFGKRYSKWGANGDIILSISIDPDSLTKVENDYEPILEKMIANKRDRYSKQPRNYPNAGSVFKRPTKDGQDYYVWKLFEECNLRGYQIGDAMISDKHPGFIVNTGNATSNDILKLLDVVTKKVKEKFDIKLDLEWKVI